MQESGRTGKWVLVLLLIAAGAVGAFALDMPVHGLIIKHGKPVVENRLVGQVISGTEEFGQLVLIVAMAVAAWRLDRRHGRKVMIRILLAAILASIACECCKSVIGRCRPRWFKGQTWSEAWLGVGLRMDDGRRHSFFSGHTSAAFATATVLGTCYPPVRPVAMILAAGCGVSRVAVQQHWTSDVYVGAMVGMAIGWWFVPRGMRRPNDLAVCRGSLPEEQAGSSDTQKHRTEPKLVGR